MKFLELFLKKVDTTKLLKLVLNLLKVLAARTDNTLDDEAVKIVREVLSTKEVEDSIGR